MVQAPLFCQDARQDLLTAAKVDPNSIQLEAPPVADLESAADEQDKEKAEAAEQDKAEGKEEEEADDPAKALQQSLDKGKK